MARISPTHPLYKMMADLVQIEIGQHIGSKVAPETEDYLTFLLIDFMRTDRLYAIKNLDGKPITSIIEMLAEGDIRLNATSFDREREVHKHIGDFILFWSGLYPKHLTRLNFANHTDLSCDYTRQGRESYHLVSTFKHNPYTEEAPLFNNLSEGFEDFAFILGQVSRKSGLYAA